MKPWVRPSNLPLLSLCPAAGVTGEGQPNAGSDATELGHAFDELIEHAIGHGREAARLKVDEIADAHHVDADLLARCLDNTPDVHGDNVDVQIPCVLSDPEGEIALEGTADVAVLDKEWVHVTDWKTGQPEYHTKARMIQPMAYACALALEHNYFKAIASIIYVRDGSHHTVEIDDPERTASRILGICEKALGQRLVPEEKRAYRTGDHCTFCPGRAVCPAYRTDLSLFLSLMPRTQDGHVPITAEQLPALWLRKRQVERLCQAVGDAVKAYIEQNGPIPADEEGKVMVVREIQMKERIVKAHTQKRLMVVKEENA